MPFTPEVGRRDDGGGEINVYQKRDKSHVVLCHPAGTAVLGERGSPLSGVSWLPPLSLLPLLPRHCSGTGAPESGGKKKMRVPLALCGLGESFPAP